MGAEMSAMMGAKASAVARPRVEFTPMSLQDLDEVLRIERQACAFPWSRGNFADSITGGHFCQVCRQDGDLVGYFLMMMAVDEAHLLNIVVAEAHQGTGLGSLLLRRVMQAATNEGARSLLLEVRVSNEKALALYRRFGFRQIGVRRNYYPAGNLTANGREDALVLSREVFELSESPASSESSGETAA